MQFRSVHLCAQCGHSIPLEEIDGKAVALGIIACPSCSSTGAVNLQIVEFIEQDIFPAPE
ncbi:hypothetical protein SAMN05421770_101871 [Granulicella rosea]|uniref:MJ0042 family finger-like domain-containing protein n=1 Tax=Granulicella rosea TaxID=474952 RepID=A0A239EBX8_9BACT|nr:hypothetical protein SAMN05421770_101871 [Granulicella rosea]